jgi:hypothetical protein
MSVMSSIFAPVSPTVSVLVFVVVFPLLPAQVEQFNVAYAKVVLEHIPLPIRVALALLQNAMCLLLIFLSFRSLPAVSWHWQL